MDIQNLGMRSGWKKCFETFLPVTEHMQVKHIFQKRKIKKLKKKKVESHSQHLS